MSLYSSLALVVPNFEQKLYPKSCNPFFSVYIWQLFSELSFSRPKQYISLPGYLTTKQKSFELYCRNNVSHIYMTRFSERKNIFTFTQWEQFLNLAYSNIYFLKVKNQKKDKLSYTVFATFHFYAQSLSWNEASELCKKINATLPTFLDRGELETFTAMLKKADKLPFMSAVFIGLKYKTFMVSSLFITIYLFTNAQQLAKTVGFGK